MLTMELFVLAYLHQLNTFLRIAYYCVSVHTCARVRACDRARAHTHACVFNYSDMLADEDTTNDSGS